MSGYRQSSFDPNAGSGDTGPPLRPYNWVQWTGVAIALVGIAIDLVYLGGRAGITPKLLDEPGVGIALPLIGVTLVNSRRQPGRPLTSETRHKRMVILAIGLMLFSAALITILVLKGA